jgi:hypothetical protein
VFRLLDWRCAETARRTRLVLELHSEVFARVIPPGRIRIEKALQSSRAPVPATRATQAIDPDSRRIEPSDGVRWRSRGRRPCAGQPHMHDNLRVHLALVTPSRWGTIMTVSRLLVAFLFVPATAVLADEPQVVQLWPKGAPGFESRRDEPELAKSYWVKNIHNPSLTVFLPPEEKASGAAVVICPGGGHRELVFNAEGVDAARYLNSIGVAAFALKYRLGREQGSPYSIEKHAREDGMRAMRLVRARAKEWNVDPARLGIMGFSAGGEVASMVAFNPGEGDPKAADPIDDRSAQQPA